MSIQLSQNNQDTDTCNDCPMSDEDHRRYTDTHNPHPESVPLVSSTSIPSAPITGAERSNAYNPTNKATSSQNNQSTVSKKDIAFYRPLFKAAFEGDMKAYQRFFTSHPGTPIDVAISSSGKTVLHVAAASGQTDFVEDLVANEAMTPELLLKTDSSGHTTLFYGVAAGNYRAVKAMFDKNPKLAEINNKVGNSPILESALLGNKELLEFLFVNTVNQKPIPNAFQGKNGVSLLNAIISAEFYDIAISLVQLHSEVAIMRNGKGSDNSALDVLAEKCSSFKSGTKFGFWERHIYSATNVVNSNYVSTGYNHVSTVRDLENAISEPQNVEPVSKTTLTEAVASYIQQGLQWSWDKTKLMVPCIKSVHDTKLKHQEAVQLVECICNKIAKLEKQDAISDLINNPFLVAAECGAVEFITVLLDTFPSLMWIQSGGYTILHYCIKNRQEKVFDFLHGQRFSPCQKSMAAYLVENGNNILHLAAKLPSSEKIKKISGAALQMQSEIQWFKAVEKITKPTFREMKNYEEEEYDPLLQLNIEKYREKIEARDLLEKKEMHKNEIECPPKEKKNQNFLKKKFTRTTPRDLFLKEHKELLADGEAWIRGLATSCSVVGALITTMVFAAALTVPGGNNEETGIPMFIGNRLYRVFAFSNALSLISSLTSVLIFLSALTSRYGVDDFLVSLPRKVIFGLGTLFISIATMFMAFISTYFIMFSTQFAWVAILVALLISVPAILYVGSQFPLFVELLSSTYGKGILNRKT